ETLQEFEGKMDKLISTDTIHTISNKKLVFENVYSLLRPGGQVALHFLVDSCYYNFLTVLLGIPKFKKIFKGEYTANMYPKERRAHYYKQMLEEVGFQYVESKVFERKNTAPSDEEWIDLLFERYRNIFEIPPDSEEDIKEEFFRIYVTIIEKNRVKYCHRVLMLKIQGWKP
ncbi:hypothetical protein NPIL_549761, partial [Nephila pilipes]